MRLLLLASAIAFVVPAAPVSRAAAPAKPNLVYIMVDDLGYGDLGCYGQKRVLTPRLDRMAAEGLRFTDHYSGHTVCRPSRLCLWMGQHVGTTGLDGNRKVMLSGRENTVGKRLQAVGYRTGGVGKWALGHVETPDQIDHPGHPNDNGFHFWFGYLNQSNAHNFYPTHLWRNKEQVELPGNVIGDYPNGRGRVSKKRVIYSHDVMTEAALDFVRRHADKPFLLHVHWTIPHANNEGGRVLKDGMEIPDYGPYEDKDWPNPEKGFAAMVTRMDGDVGRLLDLLAELKLEKRTLVMFTSDNGPHSEGGHRHEYFDSNGPLQGMKRSMHEGGIRVPMIARWPGTVAPGSTTDHPSAAWDWLPTACELAGADAGGEIDGISYVPTLLGTGEQKKHEYLYWSSTEGATSVGLRQGDWKLVKYRKPKRGGGEDWRLYDLSRDLGEVKDLAAGESERLAAMRALLKRDGLKAK